MSRKRWYYIDGEAIPEEQYESEPQVDYHVMPDIQPYQSMVDGTMIGSRAQHREHLRRHGLKEIGNEMKYLQPKANLKGTGQKEALIHAVQRAKEQYGSRHVERQISEALNRASEMKHRR